MPPSHKNDFQSLKHDLIKQSKIDTAHSFKYVFLSLWHLCLDPCHYMLKKKFYEYT